MFLNKKLGKVTIRKSPPAYPLKSCDSEGETSQIFLVFVVVEHGISIKMKLTNDSSFSLFLSTAW